MCHLIWNIWEKNLQCLQIKHDWKKNSKLEDIEIEIMPKNEQVKKS